METRATDERRAAGDSTSHAAMSAIERTLTSPWRLVILVGLGVSALSWLATDRQRQVIEQRLGGPDTFEIDLFALFLPEFAHYALWALLAPSLLGFLLFSWSRLHPILFAIAQLAACFGLSWSMGLLESRLTSEIVSYTGAPVQRIEQADARGGLQPDGANDGPGEEMLPPFGPPSPDRMRRGERPPQRFERDPRRGRPRDAHEAAQRQLPGNILLYLLALGLSGSAYAFLRQRSGERRTHELETEASELEGQLARAQLRSLRAQLQPHFLFNALHGVGGLVREKRQTEALRMLSDLGQLLRRTLDADRVDQWSLATELDLIDEYLSVESVRLGDRLKVERQVADDARPCSLPPLLLLPIVENSIRHGIAVRPGAGRLVLRASRTADRLHLEVEDSGPGFPADVLRHGSHPAHDEVHVGLQNTRERLERLHPGAHVLALSNSKDGGALVVLEIPIVATTSPPPARSHTGGRPS